MTAGHDGAQLRRSNSLPARFEDALDAELIGARIAAALPAGVQLDRIESAFARFKGGDGSIVSHRLTLLHEGHLLPRWLTLRFAPLERLEEERRRFAAIDPQITWPLAPVWLDPDLGCLSLSFPCDRRLTLLPKLLQARWIARLLRESAPGEATSDGPTSDGPTSGDRTAGQRTAGSWTADEWKDGEGTEGEGTEGEGTDGAPRIASDSQGGSSSNRWRIRKRKSSWTLSSYRPERRAVLCWNLSEKNDESGHKRSRQIYVRYHSEALRTPAALHAALIRSGLEVPALLATPRENLRVEAAIEGRPLSRPSPTDLVRAGALCARLHECRTDLSLPACNPERILGQAESATNDLQRVDEALARRARQLTQRLRQLEPAMSPERNVLIHGDLHARQFLFRRSSLALLDFDRAGRGQAAEDRATFLAHLHLEQVGIAEPAEAAFDHGYLSVRPLPEPPLRRWYEAAALLRIIDQPLRRVMKDPAPRISRLLDRVALLMLEERS